MTAELFESSMNENTGLAGVFEFDGEVAYFYLYDASDEANPKVVDSLHIFSGSTDLQESDILVKWDSPGRRVALFIKGLQWAVFDCEAHQKFGGQYSASGRPAIPEDQMVGT